MKSWRTTTIGVLSGIVIIAKEVIAILDSDPATVFSIEGLFAGLGALGIGYFARDNSVSSEDAGAK